MKKYYVLFLLLIGGIATLQAQEEEKKEVKKKVVIIKKEKGPDGKVVEKRIEAEGEEADAILKEMKEKGELENIDIEIDTDKKIRKVIKTKSTTIAKTKGMEDGKEVEVEIESGENDGNHKSVKIMIKSDDGDEVIEWMGNGEMPDDIKKELEDRDIDVILKSGAKKKYKIKSSDGTMMEWDGKGEMPEEMKKIMDEHDLDIKSSKSNVFFFKSDDDEEDLPETTVSLGVMIEGNRLLVSDLIKNSSAQKAGIKAGDRITEINGYGVLDYGDLVTELAKFNPDDEIEVRYLREGKASTVKVKLQAKE